jgi:Zn-dependent peptidase ImmA (M78 family)
MSSSISPPGSSGADPIRHGVAAARALRFELEAGLAAIGGAELWNIIRQRGVHLAFHDFGRDGADGIYLWDGLLALIVLNSAPDVMRVRFTAAHELAHHEMHRLTGEKRPSPEAPQFYSDKGDVQESREGRDVVQFASHHTNEDEEMEAHAFAAEFLAPAKALRRDVAALDRPLAPLDVVLLMQRYAIRYGFLVGRLTTLGLITGLEADQLRVTGDELANLKELAGFDEAAYAIPAQPLPAEYVVKAVRLFQHEAIDEERLADLLRTDVDEAIKRASEVAPLDVATPSPSNHETG